MAGFFRLSLRVFFFPERIAARAFFFFFSSAGGEERTFFFADAGLTLSTLPFLSAMMARRLFL